MSSPIIVWFRYDLRLQDNPAWHWACELSQKEKRPLVPLYLSAPESEGIWQMGGASRWWLHHALEDLAAQLAKENHQLVIRKVKGSTAAVLSELESILAETQGTQLCWNRRYEPDLSKRDGRLKEQLKKSGHLVRSFNGTLLFEPDEIKNKAGKPFQVFTPFWKHLREQTIPKPLLDLTKKAQPFTQKIASTPLSELGLLPSIPWDKTLCDFWKKTPPMRQGALQLLKRIGPEAPAYLAQRDLPALDGTSRLAPALHFGQLSPREFFHGLLKGAGDQPSVREGIVRQLYWREFSAHLLHHFPHSQESPLRREYDAFPTHFRADYLKAWQVGETGFPIVDAGMRQLWQTGWMHNRVRMIVASFLVKHLLQPWQEGARWFWDTLCDADLANNTMGWQWIAGCGADAAPYFRIFNPITQGQKFDPTAAYVRRWVPELAALSDKEIHTPWEVPPLELAAKGITLGKDYPHPIISHPAGRENALRAFAQFKEARADQ